MRTLSLLVFAALAGAAHAQAAPPAAFGQCAMCHAVKPGGPKKLGPELSNVAGNAAAAKAGFAYSKALKGAGIVWSDAKLDAFLAAPSKAVPGTSMVFVGVRDPASRATITAYLKTLK